MEDNNNLNPHMSMVAQSLGDLSNLSYLPIVCQYKSVNIWPCRPPRSKAKVAIKRGEKALQFKLTNICCISYGLSFHFSYCLLQKMQVNSNFSLPCVTQEVKTKTLGRF